ncbi:hypothetical protein PV327_005619 [Microctonus hyperodae]|uniref:Uncharacterized protein n=1 Tax=Microctonus hyperodae TaxID=165561 RepID=A0AA39L014_MICHY|nr:hypothetical protein PV327_005619 [Microctonus hyperodae]
MYDFNERDVFENICNINAIKSMRVTVKFALQAGIAVGVTTTVGGLLLGRRGIVIGAILGGLGASAVIRKRFKSVPDIIMNDLTSPQRKKFYDHLIKLFFRRNITNMKLLLKQLRLDSTLINNIANLIRSNRY